MRFGPVVAGRSDLAVVGGWLVLHVTLEDAGNYITKLPKAEHAAPEWQDAMEALILVATRGGPTMLARIGVMRALNRKVERVSIRIAKKRIGKLKRDG